MHLRKWDDTKGCTEVNENAEVKAFVSRREDGSCTEQRELFSCTDKASIENGQGYC